MRLFHMTEMGEAEPRNGSIFLLALLWALWIVAVVPRASLGSGMRNPFLCVLAVSEAAPSGRPWRGASALWDAGGSISCPLSAGLHLWVQAKIIQADVKWVTESSFKQFSLHKLFSGLLPLDAKYITKCYRVQIFWAPRFPRVGKVLRAWLVKRWFSNLYVLKSLEWGSVPSIFAFFFSFSSPFPSFSWQHSAQGRALLRASWAGNHTVKWAKHEAT